MIQVFSNFSLVCKESFFQDKSKYYKIHHQIIGPFSTVILSKKQ
jgi:hypothetical protein